MTERFVDGNAIGGLLADVFGRDMTADKGCCAGCGAVDVVAAARVYRSGPGDVIRCARCESVLMVIARVGSGVRVSFANLRWLQPA
jgi:hypothetical protein